MALTATFAADFSAFSKSISDAQVHLQVFDRATKTASRGITRELEAISGQKVAVEAAKMAEAVKRLGGEGGTAAGLLKLTDAELKRVSATMDAAAQKAAKLGEALPESISAIQKQAAAMQTAQKTGLSYSQMMQGVLAGAAAAVTSKLLGAASAAAQFGAESLARGSQMQALGTSFERLSGGAEEAERRLNSLRKGSSGLVDDLALMQSANKSMLLGLGLTAEQMGDLAKTATTLGRAMGQDATKSLDDLITALGRSSPMILDNLGLTVKVGEANDAYAASLGKSADALTEAEKKQAFMNAAMTAARAKVAELGEVQLTASEQVTKLWTSFRNLADATANMVVSNGLVTASIRGLADGMTTLGIVIREGPAAAMAEYNKQLMGTLPSVEKLTIAQQQLGVALSEDALFKAMEGTKGELERINEVVERVEALNKAVRALGGADAAKGARDVLEQLNALGGPLKVLPSRLESMAAQLRAGAEAARVMGDTRLAEQYELLARTLAPVVQLQQRFNVTIGEFVTPAENFTDAVRDQIDALRELDRTIRIGPLESISLMTNAFEPFKRAVQQVKPELVSLADEIKNSVLKTLMSIPQTLADAFTGGGDIMGALKSIASQIGKGLGQMAASAMGFIGPWGQAIGGAIGSLAPVLIDGIRKLFGGRSVHDDIRRRVSEWAGPISDGLAKAIAQAADDFNGNRQAAEIFSLDKIIGEKGLNPENFGDMVAKLRDVFVMFEKGAFTAAQAVEVLDKNWQAFVEAGTDASGRLAPELREIIALYQRMGLESKEITKYLQQQADSAIDGFNKIVAASKKATDEWAKYGEAVRKATESGDRDAITKALTAQHKAAEGARKELENLGIQALAVFNAAIAAGEDYYTALQKIQPSLATLRKAYADLGINIDNAALSALLLQSTMLENAPELIAGVQGLSQTMVALSNMNMLNADTFAAMQETGMQMYTRLQAAAAASGGTTKDALLPMQKYLHDAEEAAKELGVPLDANTQMLIDQSKELGIWKEKGKSANEKMLEGIERMIAAIEALDRAFRGLPADPFPAAPDYSGATPPSAPQPGGPPTGPNRPPPIDGQATNPPLDMSPTKRPTPTAPAPTPTASADAVVAAQLADAIRALEAMHGAPVHVAVNLDGRQVAMAVVEHIPNTLNRLGVRAATWP